MTGLLSAQVSLLSQLVFNAHQLGGSGESFSTDAAATRLVLVHAFAGICRQVPRSRLFVRIQSN